MLKYCSIGSGSSGNCHFVSYKDTNILIDAGLSGKRIITGLEEINADIEKIKGIFITHEHSDHFRPSTIRKLAAERPTLRFGCCRWMVPKLIDCGVSPTQIDVYDIGKRYDYKVFALSPIKLYHDVPNCGYRLYFGRKRVLYATDTRTMEGISAKGYDYYFIEANYKKEEIKRKIADKKEQGEYAYEVRAMNEHLSQEEAEDFIYSNMTSKSRYIFLHEHIDK